MSVDGGGGVSVLVLEVGLQAVVGARGYLGVVLAGLAPHEGLEL
jgi:hypothetical protein